MSSEISEDTTPCWPELDWPRSEIARLENEVSRRDAVLDWIAKNAPATLELCPIKLIRS